MATKKTGKKQRLSQQQMLAEIVAKKGSGRAVAEEIRAQGARCSQQSVDAWMKGHWPPRPAMQQLLLRMYKIPMPWGAA